MALKVSNTSTNFIKIILSSTLSPTLKKMIGLKFEYFHLVWKEHMLSFFLGPTKHLNIKWGSNLNTLKQDLKRTYSIFNLGPQWKIYLLVLVGLNLGYMFWQGLKNRFNFQPWAAVKIVIVSGVQPWLFFNKVFKKNRFWFLVSALGPALKRFGGAQILIHTWTK